MKSDLTYISTGPNSGEYKTIPKGTTQEQWERYYADLKSHQEYCERVKPKRENYLSEQRFDLDMKEWHRILHMDAPNEPGYYRAAND